MSKQTKAILYIIAAVLVTALILYYSGIFKKPGQPASPTQIPNVSQNSSPASSTEPVTNQSPGVPTSTISAAMFVAPINDWQNRVTKKPFGIYITPQTSPVQPEHFTGYHTGVDFETFADEQNLDIPIYAICDGPLKVKEYASGYGGVAVQACKLENQDITVIYGHLRLSSITANIGEQLSAGEKLAVLGTGFSAETDGERKHLHLGIHKGGSINILGYVQNQSELNNWLDVLKYLK